MLDYECLLLEDTYESLLTGGCLFCKGLKMLGGKRKKKYFGFGKKNKKKGSKSSSSSSKRKKEKVDLKLILTLVEKVKERKKVEKLM